MEEGGEPLLLMVLRHALPGGEAWAAASLGWHQCCGRLQRQQKAREIVPVWLARRKRGRTCCGRVLCVALALATGTWSCGVDGERKGGKEGRKSVGLKHYQYE